MASLNKIHVNSSTNLSLNDRFTAMAERSHSGSGGGGVRNNNNRGRSRSRSLVREYSQVDSLTASANRRLLLQLERRHKMLAAMKLKRRSLRPTGFGNNNRGNIKALRLAPNGKPIKTNSLSNIATMNADYIGNGRRRRPLRRAPGSSSSSSLNMSNRLGIRQMRGIGGAAERVAKRNLTRLHLQLARNVGGTRGARGVNGGGGGNHQLLGNRRSRSRVRTSSNNNINNNIPGGRSQSRGRSQQRSQSQTRGRPLERGQSQTRGRPFERGQSQTRGRPLVRGRSQTRQQQQQPPLQTPRGSRPQSRTRRPIMANNANTIRRGRSMSRNRSRNVNNNNNTNHNNRGSLPIKARLGVRPGNRNGNLSQGLRRDRNGENPRRNNNVLRGRVQKRIGNGQNGQLRNNPAGGRLGQIRGRSQSRTRKGQPMQKRQLQQVAANSRNDRTIRRGRSRQRGGFRNGNTNGQPQQQQQQRRQPRQQQQQQQQRRGRSRQRGGGRTLGNNNPKTAPKKEDLDKELDQYMATTKTETDMDYLLKN